MPKSSRTDVLLVAATELELCGHEGLACGVGPVEAAAVTARALAETRPRALLHVGIAGARRLTPGSIVVGTESVYLDLAAAIPVVDRVLPNEELVARARAALPDAVALPIATSGAVSEHAHTRAHDLRVEGMEGFGVLRACALAGVSAVEVRAVSNELGEADRALWMVRRGLETLAAAIPQLLGAVAD